MQFNPDSDKHANELFFSLELSSNNLSYPRVQFHCNGISKHLYQKHLGTVLNSKLNFNAHVDQKIKKSKNAI